MPDILREKIESLAKAWEEDKGTPYERWIPCSEAASVLRGVLSSGRDDAGSGDKIEIEPGIWITRSRAAAEALWKDLPLNEKGFFRTIESSLDCVERHMIDYAERCSSRGAGAGSEP